MLYFTNLNKINVRNISSLMEFLILYLLKFHLTLKYSYIAMKKNMWYWHFSTEKQMLLYVKIKVFFRNNCPRERSLRAKKECWLNMKLQQGFFQNSYLSFHSLKHIFKKNSFLYFRQSSVKWVYIFSLYEYLLGI